MRGVTLASQMGMHHRLGVGCTTAAAEASEQQVRALEDARKVAQENSRPQTRESKRQRCAPRATLGAQKGPQEGNADDSMERSMMSMHDVNAHMKTARAAMHGEESRRASLESPNSCGSDFAGPLFSGCKEGCASQPQSLPRRDASSAGRTRARPGRAWGTSA